MSRFTTWRRIFAVAAVLLLAGAGVAVAQEQTGNLFGTVTDTQGEALPGVRVGSALRQRSSPTPRASSGSSA